MKPHLSKQEKIDSGFLDDIEVIHEPLPMTTEKDLPPIPAPLEHKSAYDTIGKQASSILKSRQSSIESNYHYHLSSSTPQKRETKLKRDVMMAIAEPSTVRQCMMTDYCKTEHILF
jgi:hypothetical protein